MHDDERYVYDALRAGASGYVLKRAADADLVDAVRAVADGRPFVSPHAEAPRSGWPRPSGPRDPLTPRELDVVKLIAEAYTNKQIAEILHLSEKTVESHRANVLAKLGMRDRVELVRYAIRRGLDRAVSAPQRSPPPRTARSISFARRRDGAQPPTPAAASATCRGGQRARPRPPRAPAPRRTRSAARRTTRVVRRSAGITWSTPASGT